MKIAKYLSLVLVCLVIYVSIEGITYGVEKVRGITSDSIRIGVSVPLTKFLADNGRQAVMAYNAYIKYINDLGGIYGRKLVLVVDDSQLDPSISLGIFKKQLTNDNIFAHISWGTPPSGPLIKPAVEERIPLLILGGAKSFYIPPKKYVFCFMTPYEMQTAACVTYINDVLKKKDAKIAIFWRNDDFGKTALIGGEEAAKYYKYEVVAKPSYMLGQAIDFTAEVMKIKRAKADFVLLGSSVGDVAGFLREAKNQGLTARIIGALSPCSERKIIYQAGDAAENYIAVFSTAMFKETNIPGVKKMLEISKGRVPDEVLAEENMHYLDQFLPFQVITESLKRAGKNPTPENFITQGLEMTKDYAGGEFSGLSAPTTFSSTRHYSATSVFLGKVNMETKNFDRITDWFSPPQDLFNRILK